MKKILLLLLTLCLTIGLAACSGSNNSEEQTSETEGSNSGKDTLVVYFSVTGNTKGVAEKIADITGADVYEIEAAEEYTSEDIDYDNSDSRTTREQNDSSAAAIRYRLMDIQQSTSDILSGGVKSRALWILL